MQRLSEVVGLPVICVDNGKKLGIVKDVIFCPKTKEVKAFLLERKGCQISKKLVLLKDVVNLGNDAVTVNDCSCIIREKDVSASEGLKDKGEIRGLRIYSRAGNDLGIVKDVLFDYKTGLIEGIEVSDGLIQDIYQGRNIMPFIGKVEFSDEIILVNKDAVEEMTSTGGGIKKLFTDK